MWQRLKQQRNLTPTWSRSQDFDSKKESKNQKAQAALKQGPALQ